ncbi:MAG TPA: ABC transporter ATP-binding protein [Acetobacteraceae bacterium]|nr:ABC transporter ATP-binding protein [Acetobacteraceae bacterium]
MSDEHERWRPPARRRPEIPPADAPREPLLPPEPIVVPERARPPEERGNGWRWQDRVREPLSTLTANPIIRTEEISRDYSMGSGVVHALKPVSLEIDPGQLVAVHGRSGSGKTTLLNVIGGLDHPTAGRVWIDGNEVTGMPEDELVALRRHTIGFIFQAFGLIPILTAAENVEVPLRLANIDVTERAERVRILLELVGLEERAQHRPHELSGGEQQRVAIARSLANSPKLLLADEPTGQLDSRTARGIMELIRTLVRRAGVSALVATHDPILIDLADRVIELRDGQVIADSGA